jgi:hypothetical protein
VTALDDERVQLEIDADVKIAVSRRAIASIVPPDEAREQDEEAEADELDEYEGVTAPEAEPAAEEKARR